MGLYTGSSWENIFLFLPEETEVLVQKYLLP